MKKLSSEEDSDLLKVTKLGAAEAGLKFTALDPARTGYVVSMPAEGGSHST